MKALQEAKKYSMKLQEESEKRLWKNVSLPCSLNVMKELTMVLMYLLRFNEKSRFGSSMDKAWKGYRYFYSLNLNINAQE